MRKTLVRAAAALALLGGSMAHANTASSNSIQDEEWAAIVLGGALLVYALVEINSSNSPELPVSR